MHDVSRSSPLRKVVNHFRFSEDCTYTGNGNRFLGCGRQRANLSSGITHIAGGFLQKCARASRALVVKAEGFDLHPLVQANGFHSLTTNIQDRLGPREEKSSAARAGCQVRHIDIPERNLVPAKSGSNDVIHVAFF